MALVRSNLPDSARAVALAARATPADDPTGEIAFVESIVHTWLHDYDEAVARLRQFLQANPSATVEGLGWWWTDLEGYAGFQALIDPAH